MNAIIDTHALIWAVDDPKRLSAQVRAIVSDPSNNILFSSGSVWELGIKIGLSKLTLSLPFQTWMTQAIRDLRLTLLPITIECVDLQSKLDGYHRDPFDRLLVAHSRLENAALLSADPVFDLYGVQRIW